MLISEKQQLFCQEYLIDLNATQAAIRAGYNSRSANKNAARLMVNDGIRDEISRLQEQRSKATGIAAEHVIRELAFIAFANIRSLFNADGTMIPVHELDEASARSIAAIDVVNEHINTDNGTTTKRFKLKVRLNDKVRALELLGRHLGMFNGPNSTSAPVGNVVFVMSKKGRS